MRSPRAAREGQAPGSAMKRNPNAISTVVSVRPDLCGLPTGRCDSSTQCGVACLCVKLPEVQS